MRVSICISGKVSDDRSRITKNQHSVVDEEVLHIEWVQRGVAVASDNHHHPCQSDVCAVWLSPTIVWQALPVKALLLACLVVEYEGCTHDDVGNDTARSDQVDEPPQNLSRSVADLEERQAWEDHGDSEGEHGNTILGAVAQESWCAAFKSHTVQRTGSAVSVGVASGEDGCAEQGVHQVRQAVDPQVLHGNNVWRRRGGSATSHLTGEDLNEDGVGVGHNNTASKGATNEEYSETSIHGLESRLDVNAGTLGLSGNHGDVFRADNCEGCRPEAGEEALKSSQCAS